MPTLQKIVLLICFSFLIIGCSSDDESSDNDQTTTPVVNPPDDTDSTGDTDNDTGDTNDDTNDTDDGMTDGTDDSNTDDDNSVTFEDLFSFEENLVIEHSYNTVGCDDGPCDTIDESLADVFSDGLPDDIYFYKSEDGLSLHLKCQPDEGRRTEFKQVSEGPLTTPSRIEFEAVYFDIPAQGMTIAQVHNRGGNSNKPFFRLEMHGDELETVVRQDPEVSSNETEFDKVIYPYLNNQDYNGETLKIIIEKGDGEVHLVVEQEGTILIDETYTPGASTRWVTNSGIANGFYLKAGIYNPEADHTEDIEMQYTSFSFASEDEN